MTSSPAWASSSPGRPFKRFGQRDRQAGSQAPRAAGLGLPERQALHQPVLPIAAIVGSRDEYLDRQPQELIDGFRRNASRSR